jgi:hypothetical protein
VIAALVVRGVQHPNRGAQIAAPQTATERRDASPAVNAPRTLEASTPQLPSAPLAKRAAPAATAAAPALDPLVEPRLAVAPMVVDTLTTEPISNQPLEAIAPMTMAPLDITDLQRREQ